MILYFNRPFSIGIPSASTQGQAEVSEELQWKTPKEGGCTRQGTNPTTTTKHCPKVPSLPIPSMTEDQAAATRQLKFLQAEGKKLHPNKQVMMLTMHPCITLLLLHNLVLLNAYHNNFTMCMRTKNYNNNKQGHI